MSILEADHARIVAEAGAAVFAFHPEWTVTGMCDPDCLACRRLTELITEREKGYEEGKAAAAPRTLTADQRDKINTLLVESGAEFPTVVLDAILTLIHDGEATPQVKPCSTCGEPVAYLTARPGWAGGWLHHPARPLDGHPAAIDGEV